MDYTPTRKGKSHTVPALKKQSKQNKQYSLLCRNNPTVLLLPTDRKQPPELPLAFHLPKNQLHFPFDKPLSEDLVQTDRSVTMESEYMSLPFPLFHPLEQKLTLQKTHTQLK